MPRPWEKVYCIADNAKEALCAEILEANDTNPGMYKSEYNFYPQESIPPVFAQRRFDFGRRHYEPLNIAREDKAGRARVSKRN